MHQTTSLVFSIHRPPVAVPPTPTHTSIDTSATRERVIFLLLLFFQQTLKKKKEEKKKAGGYNAGCEENAEIREGD